MESRVSGVDLSSLSANLGYNCFFGFGKLSAFRQEYGTSLLINNKIENDKTKNVLDEIATQRTIIL